MLFVCRCLVNLTTGLRYTRVSAEILFDMRLALYEHLQRLSPRFYARTRLGDIVARLNNDISEIQRVAAEAALAWVGNVLFLAGSLVMMVWLDWQLALIALAAMPLSLWALVHYRRRLETRVAELRQRSADIGSFLIETLQATTLIVASNAQQRESARFRRLNDAFIDARDGHAARHLFRRRTARHAAVARIGGRVLLRRLARHRRHADAGHVRARSSRTRCACSRRRRR